MPKKIYILIEILNYFFTININHWLNVNVI